MKGISALIVCHNEESVIESCLTSIGTCVDEIILIHDGQCTDNTIKIAQKYTRRIFETNVQKGIGESWYMMGFKLCKYDWILRIDADEFLSTELQTNIKELINTNKYDAYSFIWPMWDGEKYISYKALRKNFLFRKSKIGFIDKFHYPIKVLGKISKSNFIVHHKPKYNNWTKETFDKKLKKWAKLQARDHLVPIENREVLNLNIEDLKIEQQNKNNFYRFPLLVLMGTYLLQIKSLIMNPELAVDKGFWIAAKTSSMYSYEVAKEVKKLKNKLDEK